MKKEILKTSILLTGLLIITNSCELLNDSDPSDNAAEKLEGQWKCDENSQFYKKSTLSIYNVYISQHSDDSTKVLISNFYNLGENIEAEATINGQQITLVYQTLPGDYTIKSGSGNISSNFKTINWSYKIDDGSGEIDNVTAEYTKTY